MNFLLQIITNLPHLLLTATLTLLFSSLLTSTSFSQLSPVPVLPGWGNDNEPGLSIPGRVGTYSSPIIAEIDGILENGNEVVFATDDGILRVFLANGDLLWQQALPNYNCEVTSAVRTYSTPAVGDLLGRGVPYVVIGYGALEREAQKCGGGVVAYRGSDGKRKWHLNLKKVDRQRYRKEPGVPHEQLFAVFGTPALADTNGSGTMEIGFGSFDRHVYLLNAKGKIIWHYQAADTVWSSPAFVNVDRDEQLEMIIGTDISANKEIKPRTKNGGYLYALKTTTGISLRVQNRKGRWRKTRITPAAFKLYRFRASSDLIVWQTWFPQVLFSSPVVADVLPTQGQEEIIVASGCYFPEDDTEKEGRWVKVLNKRRGRVLTTLEAPSCSATSMAVADVDMDNQLEIIGQFNAHKGVGGPGKTYLTAWKADGGKIWETTWDGTDAWQLYFPSPIIADLDGNGSLEVIAANRKSIHIYEGYTGQPLTCNGTCPEDSSDIQLQSKSTIRSTPAVGDLNNDGVLELVSGGGHSIGGSALFAWTNFSEVLSTSDGIGESYACPWPMARGNPTHTAVAEN